MPAILFSASGYSLGSLSNMGFAVALALDLVGCVLGVTGVIARHRGPRRARAHMALGLLVAGTGQALWAIAQWLPTEALPAGSVDWTMLTWSSGLVGLLLVGSGAERLVTAELLARRGARLAEAVALAAVLLGAAATVLMAMGSPASGPRATVGLPLGTFDLELVARGVALGGAVGIVAANGSGRLSGPVPYGRRIGLMLAAGVFALACATESTLGGWLAAAGVASGMAEGAGSLAAAVSVVALALAMRAIFVAASANVAGRGRVWRAGGRNAVGGTAGGGRGTRSRRRAANPTPQRVHAAPPASLAAAPVMPRSLLTLPVLGRLVYLSVPPAPRPLGPVEVDRVGPRDRPLAGGSVTAQQLDAESAGVVRVGGTSVAGDRSGKVPRAPVSAEAMATVVEMQLELTRGGHRHSIDELLDILADVPASVAAEGAATGVVERGVMATSLAAPLADSAESLVSNARGGDANGAKDMLRLAAAPHLSPAVVPGTGGALHEDSSGVLHLLPRPHLLP